SNERQGRGRRPGSFARWPIPGLVRRRGSDSPRGRSSSRWARARAAGPWRQHHGAGVRPRWPASRVRQRGYDGSGLGRQGLGRHGHEATGAAKGRPGKALAAAGPQRRYRPGYENIAAGVAAPEQVVPFLRNRLGEGKKVKATVDLVAELDDK